MPTVAIDEDGGIPNYERQPCFTNNHVSGPFSVGLTSRLSTHLFDEVVVEFYLGDGSSGVNCALLMRQAGVSILERRKFGGIWKKYPVLWKSLFAWIVDLEVSAPSRSATRSLKVE